MKLVKIIITLTIIALVCTRFIGLDWGLPYPMHPDERNMVSAIQSLTCHDITDIKNCLNPGFFAYGQAPLYLAYGGIQVWHVFTGTFGQPVTFTEATITLRIIAAVSTLVSLWILYKIITLFRSRTSKTDLIYLLLIAGFSPYFIQLSHFGTTEALLMMLYSAIVYLSLAKYSPLTFIYLGLLLGASVGIKTSSLAFVIVPITSAVFHAHTTKDSYFGKMRAFLLSALPMVLIAGATAMLFSPHSWISWDAFVSSMRYEIGVGDGTYRVFYTRQFDETIPVLFQFSRVLPYVLGLPQFILAVLGFFLLPWKDRRYNLLRLAIVAYLLPSSVLYAKWTRFISPVFPLLSLTAVLLFLELSQSWRKSVSWFVVVAMMIPGLAYISIYMQPDVRFQASEWMYENVEEGSYVLSETANVVNLPIAQDPTQGPFKNYQHLSFDFYNLDTDSALQTDLAAAIEQADYIIVPSRRVFANHTCWRDNGELFSHFQGKSQLLYGYEQDRCVYLRSKYTLLYNYYDRLFSGELGFEEVAEFTSYPGISFLGQSILTLPDEYAEETWSVFDHPVVRIFKRI